MLRSDPLFCSLIVVGWFFALAWRERSQVDGAWKFNLMQVVLVIWTMAALAGLYTAVERGLLGTPEMQIAGNGSTRHVLTNGCIAHPTCRSLKPRHDADNVNSMSVVK